MGSATITVTGAGGTNYNSISKTYTATVINKNFTIGQLVYFDPVSTATCSSSTFNLTKVNAGTSTCFKWRVISSDSSDVTLQMDHAYLASSYSDNNGGGCGGNIAFNALKDRTSTWTRVPLLNFTTRTTGSTNQAKMVCTNGSCTQYGNGGAWIWGSNGHRARIITANELMDIINTKAASNSYSHICMAEYSDNNANNCREGVSFSNKSYIIGERWQSQANTNLSLSWLIENTVADTNSGATANVYKIYNSSGSLQDPLDSWNQKYFTTGEDIRSTGSEVSIFYMGYTQTGGKAGSYGIRPVVTVPKSLVN